METKKLRELRVFKTLMMIVATFFVAAVLFMSESIDAKAATEIESVNVNIMIPVDGNTNKYEGYIYGLEAPYYFDTDTDLFGGENWCGVGYYISGPDGGYMKKDEKFVLGKKYSPEVYVKAKSGYEFTNNTKYYINGWYASLASMSSSTTEAHIFLDPIDCYKALKNIDIVVEEPVVGEKVYSHMKITTDPEGVYVQEKLDEIDISEDWVKIDEEGTRTNVEKGEKFALGYSYSLGLELAYLDITCAPEADGENHYMCSEDYTLTVNGEIFDTYKFPNVPLAIMDKPELKFPFLYKTLDKISVVGLDKPIAGNKPSFGVKPAMGTEYKLNKDAAGYTDGIKWVDITTGTVLNADSVFVKDHKYKASVVLKSMPGYYFNTDTECTSYGKPCTEKELWDDSKSDYGYKIETFSLEYTCIENNPITAINYVIDKPVVGEKPAGTLKIETTPADAISKDFLDALYSVDVSGFWKYLDADGTWKELAKDAVFEEGKTYGFDTGALSVSIRIVKDDESKFADTVNGLAPVIDIKVNSNAHCTLDTESTDPADFVKVYNFGKAEPKPAPEPEKPQEPAISPDGIAGEGTEIEALDKVVIETTDDKDLPGSSFGKLQAKESKVTKKSITLKWNKVKGAEGYIIYGNKCAKGNKYLKIAELSAGKKTFTQKKLKKGTYYKYLVVAYKTVNGKQTVITTSKTIHAATKGGKVGNAKSIKVKKPSSKKKTLKVGKKFTLKTKQIPESKKLKIKKHRNICYESSDPAIATVSSKGKIKAKAKGKCYIYIYAQNGVYSKVKITVK
ncbi:MAG: fibronectin type III domain-containing protein [Lachnospiraceae bacterium]|nr:fibronectin type III domain-containing protein [Lachnospiraceae bacterium]